MGTDAIHSAEDARRLARRRLPWMVFDYIDGAAGQETGAARNRAALDAITLRPRILRNVSQRSLATRIFGAEADRPFGIAPMGMCNLAAPGADLMLARLAARYRVPHGVSTVASTPLETILEAAEGYAWFQLYFSGDGSGSFKLAERARAAGYQTLVLTVDVPEVGRRPRELRHGFKMPFRIGPRQFIDFALHPRWSLTTVLKGKPVMANFEMEGYDFDRTESRARATWGTLARLRDLWPGKLVVKGVLDVEDARALVAAGVDAIQVSSHGARQLEAAPAPIEMLAKIRADLGSEFPVFYDSGIRSGEDILKAITMGADFVFLGRILQYAIAARGETGLEQLWHALSEELSIAMAQSGRVSLRH
ncbi:(S)-mandelate dehydrogenase MdlB [Phaeobacter gallaeciensis]|uniref:(S)-mandelate dehydrogenase MdlB n=2 Tax=Phaeobacter gallaeciensis TaxID=60890 RepID=A0AAC9ZB29_9RHOB|nr:alpha-hydroxy acid oxidase [Phaeobacter gallaeciensis]AHD10456.1 L-lactate dehydrogenase (FMN-dependent) [Phaeobacter gallaeciensis DSM 26640]ATE93719.1 (S)-mandelate dehydrogenase MdlB [Phaeobacter gallaeciensis]ATE96460.1 (S)-mandelate dehydrogenase MdlB [Phaeobacter gallaeciensis]ATF02383.1 (S)-mandelate dehydrogenase MdlB [Phaeobacter gallaeciensis]ATF06763.1 (S)-mandelate dehydrogenase MdlB [Phaeobacter gallaeciensis]